MASTSTFSTKAFFRVTFIFSLISVAAPFTSILSNFPKLGRIASTRNFPAPSKPVFHFSPCSAKSFQLKASEQEEWERFVLDLQSNICQEAEAADGKGKFCVDRWEREIGGGYGITRVLEGGNLWEKAACSVSVVTGKLSKERAAAISARGQSVATANQDYFAAACSLVFHSASPMVPTFRADVRYFKVASGDGWYGGGADLTPYYLFEEVGHLPVSSRNSLW
jgi:hypothetical protein